MKIDTIGPVRATKITPTPPRKNRLYFPAIQTERSARSGLRAPSAWPTIVAAALLKPHDGSSANITTRIPIV